MGSAGSWHLPHRSTRDTPALDLKAWAADALRGDTMLLGAPAMGTSRAEGGAVETCGGQSH